MRFFRVAINRTTGRVHGVLMQDTPFEQGGWIRHHAPLDLHVDTGMSALWEHDVQMVDLGLVEGEYDWRDEQGPCNPARHVHAALERAGVTADDMAFHAVRPLAPDPRPHPLAPALGVRDIMDCPCTIDALNQRLRAHGARALMYPKVIAWLSLTLPDHHRERMALPSVPLSVLKAMEKVRNQRDPQSGSRLEAIERLIQQRSDQDAARRHAARLAARGQ